MVRACVVAVVACVQAFEITNGAVLTRVGGQCHWLLVELMSDAADAQFVETTTTARQIGWGILFGVLIGLIARALWKRPLGGALDDVRCTYRS